jgi:hypothetical protein
MIKKSGASKLERDRGDRKEEIEGQREIEDRGSPPVRQTQVSSGYFSIESLNWRVLEALDADDTAWLPPVPNVPDVQSLPSIHGRRRRLLGMAGCPEPLATHFALLGTVGALRAAVSKGPPFKTLNMEERCQ